jgi:hypothetical protein
MPTRPTCRARRVSVDERDKLDAIGILRNTESGGWEILPLSLPTLQWNAQRGEGRLHNAEIFKHAALRVYLDRYSPTDIAGKRQLQVVPGTFLAGNPSSYCSDKKEYWYMKLDPRPTPRMDGTTLVLNPITPKIKNNLYLVGQRPLDPTPIPHSTWETLPGDKQGEYRKGILRVLGIKDREKELPTRKIHELFLPLPPVDAAWQDATKAVHQFHKLANQRTNADKKGQLPFELKGSYRNADKALNSVRRTTSLSCAAVTWFASAPTMVA